MYLACSKKARCLLARQWWYCDGDGDGDGDGARDMEMARVVVVVVIMVVVKVALLLLSLHLLMLLTSDPFCAIPPTLTLQSWLEQELRLRGVPPPPGTKADLAAELHAAWEVEEVQRPAASLAAAGGGEDAAAGDSSELAAADSSAGKPKGRPRSGKTKTAPKKDDRSSMTEKYTALRVVNARSSCRDAPFLSRASALRPTAFSASATAPR